MIEVSIVERGKGIIYTCDTEFVSRMGELVQIKDVDYIVEAVKWKPGSKSVVILVNKA
jgi:hypothetical protein